MDTATNWNLLARGMDHYDAKGYERLELPWAVDDRIVALTAQAPEWRRQVEGLGSLVGSAEQSFLAKAAMNELEAGKFYYALTPCFRVAEEVDASHAQTFMKIELFSLSEAPDDALTMMADAWEFFDKWKPTGSELNAHPTGDPLGTIDITLNGCEVGSYGHRTALLDDINEIDKAVLQQQNNRSLFALGKVLPDIPFIPDDHVVWDVVARPGLGVKRLKTLNWCCGTGLAEPRFSYAGKRLPRPVYERTYV